MGLRANIRGACTVALLMLSAAALTGCLGLGGDAPDCGVSGCAARPGSSTTIRAPQLSADGSEVTVPFWCRQSRESRDRAMAITYVIATREWRITRITNDDLRKHEKELPGAPVIPGRIESSRRCAADCSRFIYLAETPGPERRFEMFYNEKGVTRQLTHFSIRGAPYDTLDLSSDGQRASMVFDDMLAVIDVPSNAARIVPFSERIWSVCANA